MPNILIIDDNTVFLEAIRLGLGGPGCEIRCARSAEKGLEIVRTWPVDVVITDYEMPGMNGMEAIKRIKGDCGDGIIQIGKPDCAEDIVGARGPRPDLCPGTKCNQAGQGNQMIGRGNPAPTSLTRQDANIPINHKPRIILISGVMDRELKAEAKAAGADWCMGKPLDLNRLQEIVWE